MSNKLIENTEKFSENISELNNEISSLESEIVSLLGKIKTARENFVEENKPSWFDRPCFVKVHYKEIEKVRIEREGYYITDDAKWIDKVSDVLFLEGFYMSEDNQYMLPKLKHTSKDYEKNEYEVLDRCDVKCFGITDEYIIESFEIVNKKIDD